MSKLNQNNFEFLFDLILYLFYLLWFVLASITKKGEIEREKVDLDHARLPLHSDERVTYSKFISMLLLPSYS